MRASFGLLLLTTLSCCQESTPHTNTITQKIQARNETSNNDRPATYRAKIPASWHRHDTPLTESIIDTTKALCEFSLSEFDANQKIRITIHNFPSQQQEDRIPPNAQIARWKKQFTQLDPAKITITPQSFSGFAGLLFEGSGSLSAQDTAMMGWTMQLAPEHYSQLSLKIQTAKTPQARHYYQQMRSDFTIKATGPTTLMNRHRQSIYDFARSFELIEEIPSAS